MAAASMCLCAALVTASTPLIDFRLHGDHAALPAPIDQQYGPIDLTPDRGDDETTAPPPSPRFSRAIGYGRGVPLSFAVKQIVPPLVQVTYGAGVDPTAEVSWTGGDRWNRVLKGAVAPLGWHIVTGPMRVTILADGWRGLR